MHLEKKSLEDRNQELQTAYREKAKKQQEIHKLYTALKHQQAAAGMEVAADHDAENVLQAAATGSYNNATHRNGQPVQSRAGSDGSGGRRQNTHAWDNRGQGNRNGLQSARKSDQSPRLWLDDK